ncbi:MAG: hypothetical protein II557_12520 [Clostridia bacterium]|nr:hypothetical protein [Clostridia bacterium]
MKNTELPIAAMTEIDREKMEARLRKQSRIANVLWGVSLAVIGIGTLVISAAGIAGFSLPDILLRALGIANLVALPVMVWATVKKMRLRAAETVAAVPHPAQKAGEGDKTE